MKGKRKAVRYFVGFMIFMLMCTMLSRGIYAYQMPQVTVGRAERKIISHKVEVNGILEAVSTTAVLAGEGIRVAEVCIKAGEKVEEGTLLFTLDVGDLQELIETMTQELQIEKQKRSDLQDNQKIQKQIWDTAKKRAEEDLQSIHARWETVVAKARTAYDTACKQLAEYPTFDIYLNTEQVKSGEYQTLQKAAQKEESTKEEKESFRMFQSAFELSAQQEWKTGKETLEAVVKEKEEALQNAEQEKADAEKRAKRELEDASIKRVEQSSDVLELDYRIAAKEKCLEVYESYLQAEGMVLSTRKGTVQKVNLSPGERTTDGAALILEEDARGWKFSGELSEAEKEYINVGDKVTLDFRNGEIKLTDIPIVHISRNENGNYEVTAEVSDDRLTQGESGSMQLTVDKGVQECCVPLSCLYASEKENYVLILQEEQTFLGTEYRVEKRKVVVEDKNGELAALKDNPLGAEDRIVILSDRFLAPGDRVRMLEEDD